MKKIILILILVLMCGLFTGCFTATDGEDMMDAIIPAINEHPLFNTLTEEEVM